MNRIRYSSVLSALLAAGAALFASAARAQVTVNVQTVGGGVRRECGPSYGFVGGNTWSAAQFNLPFATALDSAGDLWVADVNNSDIEEVTAAGNRTSSLTYEETSGGNDHLFPNVVGVAVDGSDNLYVLTTTTLFKYSDVTGSFPNLNRSLQISLSVFTSAPATAIAIGNDPATNIYISFTNSSGGTILALPQPYNGTYRSVVANYHFAPAGLTVRADGLLAASDTLNSGIYVIATNSGSTPTLVTGGNGAGYVNGGPAYAKFNQPRGIAASSDGRMVVCDTMNNYVRVVDSSFNTTTLYGTASNVWTATYCSGSPALYAGWVDGTAGTTTSSASGRQPVSVTIAPSGTLFVTESYYNLIRAVTGSGLTPVSATNSASSTTNVDLVQTLAATSITGTNAILNASVDPENSSTTVYFEWGTTTNYGSTTAAVTLSTNLGATNAVAISLAVTPDEVIHFQAVGVNNGGTAYGGDRSFITPFIGPSALTLSASNITSSNAIINASINPEGAVTTVYFEYGVTTNYGSFSTTNILSANLTALQNFSATLAGLAGGVTNHFQVIAINSAGTNYGGDQFFATTPVVPVVTFSPSYGYFPECQTITVTSTVPTVYYTENGSLPTTNSSQVFITSTNAGIYTGTFQWCNAASDLTGLQVIAYNGTVASGVIFGTSSPSNQIGFATSPSAGIGSVAYIPIVADLQSNTSLKSLQLRVEVTPNGGAPALDGLSLTSITSNDFVQLIGPALGNAAVSFQTTNYVTGSNTSGMVIYALGSGSGLFIENYAAVGLLRIEIPYTANVGQSYTLNVVYPSGTANGAQSNVLMTALTPQTLTVADLPYLAGDSSPATGYDAGEFGDGVLDNSDVNNAIYASMLIRVPPADSDAFNAMDVAPQTAGVGGDDGDGVINFQDWNQILFRSLGLNATNWLRFWTNGGYLDGVPITGGAGLPGDPAVPEPEAVARTISSPPGFVWFCQASLSAGTSTNAAPGSTCSLPIYANVLPGYSLSGFQFRAIVSPNGNGPAVGGVTFTPAANIPAPLSFPGLSTNDILNAWALGAFTKSLEGSNYIGTVNFQIPLSAIAGQSYAVHFLAAEGAPDSTTDYTMESFPGYAWVLASANTPASQTSDEWKVNFFGSLTSPLAADNVDADGDGALNWQEYLAGTNPTNALSALRLTMSGNAPMGVSWLTAPGKTYVLQTLSTLGKAGWISVNTNFGNGYSFQLNQTNQNGAAQFYRLLLQP